MMPIQMYLGKASRQPLARGHYPQRALYPQPHWSLGPFRSDRDCTKAEMGLKKENQRTQAQQAANHLVVDPCRNFGFYSEAV